MLASGQPVSTPTAAYLAAIVEQNTCPAATPLDFRNPDMLDGAYKHRAARYTVPSLEVYPGFSVETILALFYMRFAHELRECVVTSCKGPVHV